MKRVRHLDLPSVALIAGMVLTLGLASQASAGHDTRSCNSGSSFRLHIGHGYDRHRSTRDFFFHRRGHSPTYSRHTYARHGYGYGHANRHVTTTKCVVRYFPGTTTKYCVTHHGTGFSGCQYHRPAPTVTKCVVRYFPGTTTKHCVTHHGTGFAGCKYHRPATTVTKCVVEHYPGTRVEYCKTHRHSGYAHCGWWQKRRHFVSYRGY